MNPLGAAGGEGGAEGRWEAAGAGGAPGSPSSSTSSSSQALARSTLGLPRRILERSRARRPRRASGAPALGAGVGKRVVRHRPRARAREEREKERSPAASPALTHPAPRVAGCSSHPRPPPCSLLARAGFQAVRCARASAGRGAPGPAPSRGRGSWPRIGGRGGAMSGAGTAGPVCCK